MVQTFPAKKSRFSLKWLVLLLLVAAAAYHYGPRLLHSGAASPGGEAGAGVPISVATVLRESITRWHSFSGMLEAVNAVEIRPQVSGQITRIHFTDGAEVKKGQPLFTIDPRPYEAELLRAKGALATAQAAAANAQQEYARAKKLVKTKAVSQSEYELKASNLSQALGALETAKGAFNNAQVNLNYTQITAPLSGKISRAEVTLGNLVNAASPPLMASIVDLSPIYASFDVDEQTFLHTIQGVPSAKLKTIPVEVTVGNAKSASMPARIHSFDNQITPGSGTIRVRATLANADGLLIPGLFAKVRIGSPDMAEVILIHPSAVGTDQSKKFVMVLDEANKAQYREVTLGEISDGLQVILSGLSPDEKIVVNGLQRVQPGAMVIPGAVDMKTLAPLAPPANSEAPPPATPTQEAP